MIFKYGKEINMLSMLGRDLEKKCEMMDKFKKWAEDNVSPFKPSMAYQCRICGGEKLKDFVVIYGHHYSLCEHCGCIVLLNAPDIKKLYTSNNSAMSDYYLNEDDFIKRAEKIAMPKIKFVLEYSRNVQTLTNWCDIGCGVGELLMGIKLLNDSNRKIEVCGIESDPREIQFARQNGFNIIEGFLDPSNKLADPVADAITHADIVSLFNVLEHIENPAAVINILKKMMKPGSLLVLEMPHHPSLASFSNLVSPQYTYRHIIPPVHLQIFSEKSVEILVYDSFEIVAKWGFGQGYTDILTSAALLGGIKTFSLYDELMNISNDIQKEIDRCGYSDQMLYIMKKQGCYK